ncbi:MAG: ion transporter [Caldilinea sp.]|nr:ion transporter [Caldilinea sp.]MCB0055955.1 ion transporter [Caldilineaceae bacterium]MCB0054378.1 ion transporter [Caldilinea sp.]MCB9117922.1 ion transporter [Caldilineaceae bacterium]MCB9121485.1 ion transporter [Caldilineaceae bacterium]
MSPKLSSQRELKGIGYELFIGALSILSILNLILIFIFSGDPNVQTVLTVINAIVFPIFLGDFFYRLFTAESRTGYFFRGFGWADLLSSLPFQNMKILRLFRLWRVVRLFAEFGVRNLVKEFITQRAQNALLTVGFLVLCVLEFGALSVLRAESASADANITSAADALWWTYVTITTVGYGDRFPVTNSGRLVGIFVMTAGVGLFGTLSGFLANSFLAPPKKRDDDEAAAGDAADPKARLAALKRMIEEQEESTARLKAQLEEIDKLL